ncbi:MAG TPA: penicillin-binding protein 2 [Candidatus Limnocylindrales bacterium]|nr:penicillin-binding protein 2 [Candidatus Limnocylindrales bacterium]
MTGPARSLAARQGPIGAALVRVGLALAVAFAGIAGGAGYWQVLRSSDLSGAPDDAAVIAASRQVVRGLITDRDGRQLAWNARDSHGEPFRVYASPALSGVIGYAATQWGTAGLEQAWNAELTGVRSADPLYDLTRKFRAGGNDPEDLRTTLVLSLQQKAVQLLGSDRGAVVLLDPRTGEVLVMASTPDFDASAVANPTTSAKAFAALQADPSRPLFPRATSGTYVPGSIFKIVTAMAALSSGAISTSTTYPQQPAAETTGLLVDGFRVRDGHHRATDGTPVAFDRAVEVSCNIYFALTGLRTGGRQLLATAASLGFGAQLPFDLSTSSSQVTGGGGSFQGGFADEVELANAAYGQAETLVTPLQMALVAATVANDGVLMTPHLVLSASGAAGTTTIAPEVLRRVVSASVAGEIRDAMVLAVNGPIGRLFTAGAQVPGVQVAGKSGTAELDPGSSPHSWFIGFAPAGDAQVAIAVIVEHGGHGSERASPIAGAMLKAWRAWVAG